MNQEPPKDVVPGLVAHRGYALRYPENTIEGLRAAMEAGAVYVEFDVQVSADGVPVLMHDAELRRTAGVDGCVMDLDLADLKAVEVNEIARLESSFRGVSIPTISEAVTLLEDWPRVTAFVELKRASLRRFGADAVLDAVLDAVRPIWSRVVLISFDARAVAQARARGVQAIGWVIDSWSDDAFMVAETIAPDYLLCDRSMVPEAPESLRRGPWRWVIYDIDRPEAALDLAQRGAHLVETMAIGELLRHPSFAVYDGPNDGDRSG